MQLLYGRDKTDYKVLSKSGELSGSMETVLINDYLGYDFVKNKSDYSDVSKEPFSISYCTTNLDGYLNNEMILVSKNGRNENYTTPSRYAHARLFEIEKESFKEKFFDIFRYSFIDSTDSEKYKDKEIDKYEGSLIELKQTTPLTEDALKSILYLLFDNFRSISNTVYVIIDNEGDSYNERSLDVIKQVYEYIPYFMRKIIGFSSYGTINQKYSNRIKLVAMTRESSEIENELKVDLLNLDLQKIEKITTSQTKTVVDYILAIDDIKRKEIFEIFDLENKKSRLGIKNLFNICISRKLWIDSSDFDKISSWIYNVVNPNELDEVLFYEMMDIIEKKLNSENFNNYLVHVLSKESNICEKYLDKDKDLYNLLLFEDILSVDYKEDYKINIDIDIDYILNWWNKNIFSILKQKPQEIDVFNLLKNEKTKYETLDLQGYNYLKLRSAMIENIDKLLLEEEKLIEEFIIEEKNNLNLKVENVESINNLNDLAKEIEDLEIKYDKNKEVIKDKYGEKLKEIANNEYVSFKELYRFIEVYKEYLSKDSISYVKNLKNKETKELKDKIEKINSLIELEVLLKSGVDDEIEKIVFNKLESLIKSFDIKSLNDEKNIIYGKKIYEKIKNNNKTNKLLITMLIDRDINLYDLEQSLDIIQKKIDFIEKNKLNLNFNINDYNLNIKINNKDYIIKYVYLENLIEYIKSKQDKPKLSISKLISSNLNTERKIFLKENKKLVDLIDKHFKK